MAADTNPQTSTDPNLPTHKRDYAGFITMVKWAVVLVAIIAATVIFLISN